MKNKVLLVLAICFAFTPLMATVKLPAIIGDNMVLQRGIKVPVWGWADDGEVVKVTFKGKVFKTVTSSDGKWSLKLDVYVAGGPFEMQIQGKDEQITLRNILIGDVWVASGQSNMEFGIQTEKNGKDAIAKANDQQIHFFYVPMASSLEVEKDIAAVPADSPNGKWLVCSPEIMANPKWAWHGFSAVGYYFAREIRKKTNSPVGMIATYKGGTPVQAWMSLPALKAKPAFESYMTRHEVLVADYEQAKMVYPKQKSDFQVAVKQWDMAVAADSNLAKTLVKPKVPLTPDGGFSAPGNLFNAMVAPVIPYGIKGVIWYQGESNGDKIGDAVEYGRLFPRLISDWRFDWGQGDFPFLYVQLPNFREVAKKPSEGNWAVIREAQLKTLAVVKGTGMAVIIDLGEANNIHPVNKLDVGLRLGLVARHIAYQEDLVWCGPVYKGFKLKRDKIYVSFGQVGKGLVSKSGVKISETGVMGAEAVVEGFGIAGKDGKFVWAKAEIVGDEVVVYSDQVKEPVAVRYNWGDNPPGRLGNCEGLMASPFRTDDWKIL